MAKARAPKKRGSKITATGPLSDFVGSWERGLPEKRNPPR